jgi:hypothetical protein
VFNAENKHKTSTAKTIRSAIKTYVCARIRSVKSKVLFVKENTVQSQFVLSADEINNVDQPKNAPMMGCVFVVD